MDQISIKEAVNDLSKDIPASKWAIGVTWLRTGTERKKKPWKQ
jgi:hypothetical protein